MLSSKAIVGYFLLALIAIVGGIALYSSSKATITDVVVKTERVSDLKSSKYLVFMGNEVFQITDSLYPVRFNSSDLYGKLIVGKKYTCEVYGWRLPVFSMYRNLLDCKEV